MLNRLRKLAESYEWVDTIANKTIIELKKTTDILEEINNQFFERFNISNTKFNVLVILYNSAQDGVMLSDIGDHMLVTKGNITGLIDRLEKQEFVKRIRDDIDRRKIMAVITEKGRKFTEEVVTEYKEWSTNILNFLDDEEKSHLITTLRKMQTELVNL